MIDIIGLDKARVFQVLYNNARAQGMGWLHFDDNPMTEAQARELTDAMAARRDYRVDYYQGRVMKVDISGDSLDPRLYDRDNGDGAAARLIESIR